MRVAIDDDLLSAVREVALMYPKLLQKMLERDYRGVKLRDDVKGWLAGRSSDKLARLARQSMLVCSMSFRTADVLRELAKGASVELSAVRWRRTRDAAPVLVAAA